MERKCYNCGKDITSEPALEGLSGLLCFPCRYRLDEAGGEKFVRNFANYQKVFPGWDSAYGRRWKAHCRLLKWSDWLIYGLGYLVSMSVLAMIFVSNMRNAKAPLILAGAVAATLAMGSSASFVLKVFARKYSCPPPPDEPTRNKNALDAKPDVVLDSACEDDGPPACVNHAGGYPPDWSARQEKSLRRDGYRCRLCGSDGVLNVHHVKPISFNGSHSLQNLITLCEKCHVGQRYYEHKQLVEYGREVGRFLRRSGRRGRPWSRRGVGRHRKYI